MNAKCPQSPAPLAGRPAPGSIPQVGCAGTETATRLSSELLLRGARSIEIVHGGEVYRLQATRLGKLILTK